MLNNEERMERLNAKKEWEEFKVLHPKKEGKKNFKALSKPEQWDLEEEYPLVRRNPETHKMEIRSYIGYFNDDVSDGDEDEKKYRVYTAYNELFPIAVTVVVGTVSVVTVLYKHNKELSTYAKSIINYFKKLR